MIAWPVNFNLSLRSFEPSVRGVRHLVDLALASPYPSPAQIVFVSSVGILRSALCPLLDHDRKLIL